MYLCAWLCVSDGETESDGGKKVKGELLHVFLYLTGAALICPAGPYGMVKNLSCTWQPNQNDSPLGSFIRCPLLITKILRYETNIFLYKILKAIVIWFKHSPYYIAFHDLFLFLKSKLNSYFAICLHHLADTIRVLCNCCFYLISPVWKNSFENVQGTQACISFLYLGKTIAIVQKKRRSRKREGQSPISSDVSAGSTKWGGVGYWHSTKLGICTPYII